MRYFNETDVKQFRSSIILENFIYSEVNNARSNDVFLSHSSKDKEVLPSVINFLSEFNVNVYIDKSDSELPPKTTPETGSILKKRISECKKFIVLVSLNSKDSRWMPWELGIADTKKTMANIALLPTVINDSNPEWPNQEYLGLYPRIVINKFTGTNTPVWMVLDHHKSTGTELSKWLHNK